MLELSAIGVIGKIPEIKYSAKDNKPFTNFSLSCRAKMEEHNVWVDCVAFGKSAENICQFAHKGARFYVRGTPKINSYDSKQTGERVEKLQIMVNEWEIVSGKPKDEDGEGHAQTYSAPPASSQRQARAAPPAQSSYADDEDIPF